MYGTVFVANKRMSVYENFILIHVFFSGMAGFDPKDKYANIAAWWLKVRAHFSPHYEEAHIILNKIVAKNTKVKSKI